VRKPRARTNTATATNIIWFNSGFGKVWMVRARSLRTLRMGFNWGLDGA